MSEFTSPTLWTGIIHIIPVFPLDAGNCLFVSVLIDNSYRESH